MSSLALSFNEVNFTPVQQNGQIWLTAVELAKALGYAKSDAVTQVYERNKDEFNTSMTTTLKLSVVRKTGKVEMDHRIFSLRGAHLIAMFSKTAIAKQFRKWVLDILDREVLGQQIAIRQSITPEQQALLHEIVARRSQGERKIFAEMWSRHNRHFNIPRYAELLTIHFPESVHYLETMDLKARPEKHEGDIVDKLDEYLKNLASRFPALKNPVAAEIAEKISDYLSYQDASDPLAYWVSINNGKPSVQPVPVHCAPVNIVKLIERFNHFRDYVANAGILEQAEHLRRLELKAIPR